MSHEQEDQEPAAAAATSNNASDWLDESIAFLTADIDLDLDGYGWLPTSQQHRVGVGVADSVPPPVVVPQGPAPVSTSVTSLPVTTSPQEFGQPKRRKSPEHKAPGHSSQRPQVGGGRDGAEQDNGGASYSRKPSKKSGAKGGAASVGRDARWAEQLLNPCAVAIETGSLARVQHLFYVLGELASFSSGEANHRLAAYGLRALVVRLPDAVGQAAAASIKIPPCECLTPAFSGIEPRLFRASLIKFHEVSPWFALPNALANAAISHAATRVAATAPRRQLHVVDLGVSHGVQWPTLLDALSRVPRGSTPPSVRLTVAGPTATPPVPFSASPPGYDFSPQLLRYAKSINLDLAIDRATSLDALHGFTTPGDALVVCLQFRLWHVTAEEQAIILQKVRNLNPELVALAELDGGGHGDGSVPSEFAARLELLWRFLESTAAAFKGRDADERLVMEAEAGTALAAAQWGAVVDGREGWRERMAAAGFEEAAFGGEAVETAKALLRKYDGGWEMVAPSPAAGGGAVGLRWKGQPVSFCSLWRPA